MNPRAQLIAFQTIVIKEIARFFRIWQQTLLPPAITTSLYFVIFGNLIGPRIGQMDGFRYMDFIVPGLILMSVITNAYSNVVTSFFGAKFQRSVEEMLISPTPNYIILLGFVVGGVARGVTVAMVVTAVSLLFSDLRVHDLAVLLSVVVMTALLFSLGGFLNAMFAKGFDDVSIVPDVRADPTDLPWWHFLFDQAAPRVLAECLHGKPDPVHDQRLSLRLSGRIGHGPSVLLSGDRWLYHGAFRG